MPRALSSALCGLIKIDFQNGVDIKTIMATHKISDKKARKMRELYVTTGQVHNPEKKKGSGRRPKLDHEHEERLKQFLSKNPEVYLKDMCNFLDREYNIQLTESTVQRACTRIGHKLKKRARPRDELGSWVRTLPRDDDDTPIRGVRQGKKRGPDYGKKLSYTARRQLLEKTRDFVKGYMSQSRFDASHDYSHVLRVVALSLEILRVEQNTYRKITFDGVAVELVALMHDIDDHKYPPPTANENPNESYPSPSTSDPSHSNPFDPFSPQNMAPNPPTHPNIDPNLSLPQPPTPSSIESHLLALGWPPTITSKVAAIVPFISYTAETTNPTGFASALAQFPELAIVQDADRLDAIGATGVGRAFTYGGAKDREAGMGGTIQHFGAKLVKLEARMKTGEGRRMAVVRAERLKIFGRWWQEEMLMVGMMDENADMSWVQSTYPKQVMPGAPGEFITQYNNNQHINSNQNMNNQPVPNEMHPVQATSGGNVVGHETAEGSQQQLAAVADPGVQLLEATGGMGGPM